MILKTSLSKDVFIEESQVRSPGGRLRPSYMQNSSSVTTALSWQAVQCIGPHLQQTALTVNAVPQSPDA